jgi:hypothetical protein
MADEEIINQEQVDQLDEVLEGEIEEPIDEEKLETDSSEKEGVKDPDTPSEEEEAEKQEPPTVESLQAKLDELEKANKGLQNDIYEARDERRGKIGELTGRLNQVTELIAKAREGKQGTAEEEDQTVDVAGQKIPIKFDDDSNPYVDPKDLEHLTKSEVKEVENKVDKIEQTQAVRDRNDAQTQAIQTVLSSDEAYPNAFRSLDEAFKFLDTELEQIVREKDIDVKTLTPDGAMDLLEASESTMKAFRQKYPNADIETVIEGRMLTPNGQINTRKLRKALNALKAPGGDETTATTAETNKDKLKTLKAITSKPSNLSGMRNQRGTAGMSLDDMANITQEDFENMSDTDVAKLERLLRDEELRELE